MALRAIEVSLTFFMVALLCGGGAAQSSCTNVIASLAPCLNYVTGNTSTPAFSCCSQLGNVISASPQCLCALMNSSGVSLGINRTLALSLPGACNVQTPSISQCNAVVANGPSSSATVPVSSPVNAPSDPSNATPDQPANTPSTSTVSTGTESKTVPAPAVGGTSDGRVSKAPPITITLFFFLVFFASTVAF